MIILLVRANPKGYGKQLSRIKCADWRLPTNRVVCLVEPGDSTKTTLLDVVGLVLSPRWNVQFSDADFYDSAMLTKRLSFRQL